MASLILRRSSSTLSRRLFAAVVTSIEWLPHHHGLTFSAAVSGGQIPSLSEGARSFHTSLVSRVAQFAVDHDYSHHEGSITNGEEGLEITKLGISQEIVDALAKKGITKLFPIQVSSLCCVFSIGGCDPLFLYLFRLN